MTRIFFPRRQRAAGVKSEPSEPEKERAQHDERYVVRPNRYLSIAGTLSEDQRQYETRNARADMYDVSACKIDGTDLRQESAGAPHHVSHRIIHYDRPQYDKEK